MKTRIIYCPLCKAQLEFYITSPPTEDPIVCNHIAEFKENKYWQHCFVVRLHSDEKIEYLPYKGEKITVKRPIYFDTFLKPALSVELLYSERNKLYEEIEFLKELNMMMKNEIETINLSKEVLLPPDPDEVKVVELKDVIELESLRIEHDLVVHDHKQLLADYEYITNELGLYKKQVASLKSQNDTAVSEVTRVQAQIAELTKINEGLLSNYSHYFSTVTQLQQQMFYLEQENTYLTTLFNLTLNPDPNLNQQLKNIVYMAKPEPLEFYQQVIQQKWQYSSEERLLFLKALFKIQEVSFDQIEEGNLEEQLKEFFLFLTELKTSAHQVILSLNNLVTKHPDDYQTIPHHIQKFLLQSLEKLLAVDTNKAILTHKDLLTLAGAPILADFPIIPENNESKSADTSGSLTKRAKKKTRTTTKAVAAEQEQSLTAKDNFLDKSSSIHKTKRKKTTNRKNKLTDLNIPAEIQKHQLPDINTTKSALAEN